MSRLNSTTNPEGPLASAIRILEGLEYRAELDAVRRLWWEWVQQREEVSCLQEELVQFKRPSGK